MPIIHPPLAAGLGPNGPEILFYGIGVALLGALAFLAPHRGLRCVRPVERVLAALARRRGLAILAVGIFSFALVATMTALIGVPLPKVDDEFSYLLAADTFAHGRLANPRHPMWEHFETFHVLQRPTYSSKYPPGQGLLLALGQVIAHPIVGVWLAAALACAAITWMLMAWLPPRWALLGGLLSAVHPEVLLWSQRYWGGCLALAGGALAIGGFRRVTNTPRVRDALLLALGVAVLLYTRPYEGGVLTFLLGTAMLFAAIRKRIGLRALIVRAVLPCAAVLCAAAAWLGFYNLRVTGNPLRMPYQAHVAQYMAAPIFIWQTAPPQPVYHHADMRDFHTGWEYRGYAKQRTPAGLATGLVERAWRILRGELRLWFLALSFVALPWALRRDGWMRFALALTLVFFAALLLVNWTFFHYAAPVFGLFFFSSVQCMRHLRTWRWRGKPAGLFLARGSVLLCAASVLATGRDAAAQFPDVWWAQRQKITDRLHREGGRHLVVIRYAPHIASSPSFNYRDWTRNGADLDGADILWAREMDPDRNAKLLEYFRDRRAWLLDVDAKGTTLLPYPN
jgi:hypothetical protein